MRPYFSVATPELSALGLAAALMSVFAFGHFDPAEARKSKRGGLTLAIASQVVTVRTRAGIDTRYVARYRPQSLARAGGIAVILLAGGNGKLAISSTGEITSLKNNFLIRSRDLFLAGGVVFVAAVDVSSAYPNGVDATARLSAGHAEDIGAVISDIKRKTGKPVWLVSTSNGTISTASVAARLRSTASAPAGIVLTSSRSQKVPGVCGITLFNAGVQTINVPALVVANRMDGCGCTTYSSQTGIVPLLTAAPRKQFMSFRTRKGVKPIWTADPCSGLTAHGFVGIEQSVVSAIVRWMGSGTLAAEPLIAKPPALFNK